MTAPDWRKDVETVRLGIDSDSGDDTSQDSAHAALDSIQAAYEAMERENERLRALVREADLDATDSDGMFPRNPLL